MFPAVISTDPFWLTLKVELTTVAVMPASDLGEPRVSGPAPETSCGFNATEPPAGTIIVSGLSSHSDAGAVEETPPTNTSVAE